MDGRARMSDDGGDLQEGGMHAEGTGEVVAPRESTPITERVLGRLGPPRGLWIAGWALLPLLSPIVFSSAVRLSGRPFASGEFLDYLATQGSLAYATGLLLWGTGRLGRGAAAARDGLVRLAPSTMPGDLFERIGSVAGPLVATVAVAAIISANGWLTYGPLPPLAALPLLVAYLIPIMTFLWVYLAVLVDVHRIGRVPLALDTFPQDRTLGLGGLGSLASTGLGLLLAAAAPVLLVGSDEPVTLVVSLGIVALAVGTFLMAMWRLHLQMAAVKARAIVATRALYADAYAPLRATPTLETLSAQASVLGTAQALDERAHALPTWPIDEGTLRFLAVIVTGVVTSVVVRALFAAIGF